MWAWNGLQNIDPGAKFNGNNAVISLFRNRVDVVKPWFSCLFIDTRALGESLDASIFLLQKL